MIDNDVLRRHRRKGQRPQRKLNMDPQTAALLYLLLCDNARAWNADLRNQLRQVVTPTEVYNAADDQRNGRV